MGWVKICKNNQEHLVTSEIYESVFKHQGFRIANSSQDSTQNPMVTTKTQKESKNELSKPSGATNKSKPSTKILVATP